MQIISKSESFIALRVEEAEALTIKGSNGQEITLRFPEECIFNCYRKNVNKPIQFE